MDGVASPLGVPVTDPFVPPWRVVLEPLVMAGACVAVFTVMLHIAVAVSGVPPAESVTIAVKFDVPVVSGVPVIAPVAVLRFRLCGSDPEIEYVYASTPPEPMSVEEYAAFPVTLQTA